MKKEFFTGRKVLVMGLGRFGGGVDVAKFAAKAGAKVMVTDLASQEQLSDSISQLKEFSRLRLGPSPRRADIEFHLGSHNAIDFEQADIIVVNPAVPGDNEFLKLARRSNKLITSQINIFFEFCPAQIIGITGANGKSTTAALTAHLLRSASGERRATGDESVIASEAKQSQITSIEHRLSAVASAKAEASSIEHVWLSGNIGNEPLLTRLDQIAPVHLVVLELSSFQIEQLAHIRKAPKVALLTNLTPNHLDRYGTFEDYCAAKEGIFRFQKLDDKFPAVSIFNAEDKVSSEWYDKYKNDAGRLCITFSADDIGEQLRRYFALPGRANLSNLAGAMAVARHFGIDDDRIRACLPQFKALPHRLELVAKIKGVSWYNDSKATTPESAIAALEAFEQPMIIIAGGYDKKIPLDEFGGKIAKNAKAAILLGQTAEQIASAIRNARMSLRAKRSNLNKQDTRYEIRDTKIEFVNSLAEAVELANRLADGGDVVLLSPACASYDMFENFQDRGRQFVGLVHKISG